MDKKKIIGIGIAAVALVVISILGTYAYFITSVTSENQEVKVTAGTMSMTFADRANGINASLMFGESVTKEFTIENTGTLSAVAKINWDSLVNTYLAESLSYTLSYATEENGSYTPIKTANVPRSTTAATVELANGLQIPAEETYYYKLDITLENLDDVDQTEDLDATLSTRFMIENGTIETTTP